MEDTFPMAYNFDEESGSKLQETHEVGFVDQRLLGLKDFKMILRVTTGQLKTGIYAKYTAGTKVNAAGLQLLEELLLSNIIEWNTHVVVWMNKAEIETMSIDDFTSSTNDNNTAKPAYEVSTVSPNVNTASPQDLEQYMRGLESNGFEVAALSAKYEGKEVLSEDRQEIFINANDTAVAPRNKEGQFKYQDNTRKQGNNKDTSSKAMLAIDGVGFDWSDMARRTSQTNMAQWCCSDFEYTMIKELAPKLVCKTNETLKKYEGSAVLKRKNLQDYQINVLKSEFEKVKQEKEGIEFKIEKFDNASKRLDRLLGSQITDKSKKGLGYNVVPLPHPLSYNRPKKLDLSYSGLDEFKEPEFKSYGSEDSKKESNIVCDKKSDASKENSDDSLVKGQVSEDTSSFVESLLNVDKETIFLVDKKVELVKPKNHEKPVKKSVRYVNTAMRHYHTKRPRAGNTARSYRGLVNAIRVKRVNAVKTSAYPIQNVLWSSNGQEMLKSHDENKLTHSYFKEFDGGYVTFGGGAHGGRISAKGTLKTDRLDFKDLPDETQILLKIHRKDNMYSFDMKNIDPKESLTCLVAKATLEEGTSRELNAGTSIPKEEINQDCIVEDGPHNESDEKDKSEDDSSPKEVYTAGQHVNTASPEVNTGRFKLNTVDPSVNTASSNDQDIPKDMFKLGASHTLETTQVEFSSDEDEPEVDLGNILNSYTIPNTPNTRIHKDHLIKNVVGDMKSSVQTRRMTKPTSEQGFLIEPNKYAKALSDSSWVKAMQEELLQFKLQQVWILVYLPIGKRAIGTKWVFRNKKDERGIMIRNKARFSGISNRCEGCILIWTIEEEVTQKEEGIFISQDKYVAEILKKFNYTDVKSASTLVDLEKPLVKDGDADDVDVHLLRSRIKVKYIKYLMLNASPLKSGDEAVHKELGDRMERAVTMRSSLEAKQDSCSGPRCQETILRGVDAQTRFETTSKQSNDLPLSRVNTLRSGEDNMKLLELMELCTKLSDLFWASAKEKMINGERQLQALVDKKKVIITETGKDGAFLLILNRHLLLLNHHPLDLRRKQSGRKQKKETEVPLDETYHDDSVPIHSNDPLLSGLKRLKKVGESRRVKSSEDKHSLGAQEDASKQGRSFEDIDNGDEVSLVDETQGRSYDAKMFDTDDLHGDEVIVDIEVGEKQEQSVKVDEREIDEITTTGAPTTAIDEITLAQNLIEIKAAKPKAVTTAATTTTTTRSKARGVVVQEPSEFRTATSSPQASQPSKTKDKGKAIMIELELQAELIEEERLARKKEEEANIALIESWENTQAMMEADRLLAERLQTREQEELTDEEKAKLFMEFMEKRRKHFAALRAQEKRNRPPTKTQKRNQMSIYLKHMEAQEISGKKDESSSKKAEIAQDSSAKRAGDKLESDKSKKQKTDENEEVEVDNEAELKKHMVIVKDDDIAIDAIPLATKPLVIVEYKLIREGIMGHYQLIRADGSFKRYSSMIRMLQGIDREDLQTLWKLVKTKHGDTRPEDEHERVLWGDLKVMFEPDIKSDVWRNLQGYKVTVWKLFDSCGVHFVRFGNVHIFMLVEKRYPLTPITITNMLNKKLQADYWNEMCYQLLKLMVKSAVAKMAPSKSIYLHTMGQGGYTLVKEKMNSEKKKPEKNPDVYTVLKDGYTQNREYPDNEIRLVGDKLKETEDKIKEGTLKVDRGTDAMRVVLEGMVTKLKNQFAAQGGQLQLMSTQLTPPNVSPVDIYLINSSADEEGGTTVVGCKNDASIQKSNGLATLEKEMETRAIKCKLWHLKKSTIIALGTIYKTDGKKMLHNKELPKDCYKVSIDTSLVDAACIPDIGNNGFKTVKDAVGGFFA
ncbi:hypothetical protein Tco_0097463 [Tanacetum coccineum]